MFGLFSPKGPFSAQVTPAGLSLEVTSKDNLLKAALAAGLAWPHSCRVGSCGTCRCRLVSGKIKPLNDFSYVLSDEELDRGMILACQTSLRSDVVVEVALGAQPLTAARSVRGVVASARPLTHDIREVRIKLDEPLPAWRAGQYAELAVPGIARPRSYSFARAPEVEDDAYVSFHVRRVPGGEMSGWLHENDRSGEAVTVDGPHGSFCLRESASPMLCIAGGSGMAPIKALLEDLSLRGFPRRVTYLYGARTQADLYCLEEMKAFAARGNGHFRFVPVLSHEPSDSDWDGLRGMVTEHIARHEADLAACQAYLCGPPPMIDAAVGALVKGGVDSGQVFFDKFLDASHLGGQR